MTDADVVRRVLEGDADAFRVLADRYYDRCLRLAAQLLGPADAEDAVQDAFLRAYRHLGSYQERDKFSAWLFRIVVNQCRTVGARRRGVATLEARAVMDAGGGAELAVEHPADNDALREELQRALSQLDADQREAVVLKFTEDMTYDEMAAVTGVGVSALKMRVQRACRRLRALLTEISHV